MESEKRAHEKQTSLQQTLVLSTKDLNNLIHLHSFIVAEDGLQTYAEITDNHLLLDTIINTY